MSWDVKYRPTTYSDVIHQEATVRILKQIVSAGRGFQQSYLLAGQHGGGKCVTGDTLVTTSLGVRPIVDLIGDGDGEVSPIDFSVLQESGETATAKFSYKGGIRKTIRIATSYGYEIEGTPNHRIRVLDKSGKVLWKRLDEIVKGDYACIQRDGYFFGSNPVLDWNWEGWNPSYMKDFLPPKTLCPEWGRLLGYLVGDGTLTYRDSVALSCADTEIIEDQERLCEALLGQASIVKDKRTDSLCSIRSFGVQKRDFLSYLGLLRVTAEDKEVPWVILQGSKEVVREFLRGLFEADDASSSGRIEFTTKSEKLSKQVQVLLLHFGIISNRSCKVVLEKKYWRLSVNGFSRDRFAEEISFVSTRKQKSLSHLLKKRKGSRITNVWEVIPHQQDHLRDVKEKVGPGKGYLFRSLRGVCRLSKRVCQKVVDEYPEQTEHFQQLLAYNYYFDPVVDLVEGEAEVFDLNVPEGEQFAANGFINHNTTIGRILARSLLCDAPVEGEPCDTCSSCLEMLRTGGSETFTEVDAATNSGKESIRKILEEVDFSSFSGKRRIYLLDESHQLSKEALDALLKPIEDTIPGTEDRRLVCIFCTTEPEKMRATIGSRCGPTFTIKVASPEQIADRMAWICEQESVEYEQQALLQIAEGTQGHIRDALKAAEMLSLEGAITEARAKEYLGYNRNGMYLRMIRHLPSNLAKSLETLETLTKEVSPGEIYENLAKVCILAYKRHCGLEKGGSYWDTLQLDEIGHLLQKNLLSMAEIFSLRPRRPTLDMVQCDLLTLHSKLKSNNPIEKKEQTSTSIVSVSDTSVVKVKRASVPVEGVRVSAEAVKASVVSSQEEEGDQKDPFTLAKCEDYSTLDGQWIPPQGVNRNRLEKLANQPKSNDPSISNRNGDQTSVFAFLVRRRLQELSGDASSLTTDEFDWVVNKRLLELDISPSTQEGESQQNGVRKERRTSEANS